MFEITQRPFLGFRIVYRRKWNGFLLFWSAILRDEKQKWNLGTCCVCVIMWSYIKSNLQRTEPVSANFHEFNFANLCMVGILIGDRMKFTLAISLSCGASKSTPSECPVMAIWIWMPSSYFPNFCSKFAT